MGSIDTVRTQSSSSQADVIGKPNGVYTHPQANGHLHAASLDDSHHQLEPIAVIGIACTFPQEATSVETFWQMLVQGRSALTDIPKDRFNVEAFCTPGRPRGGMSTASKGHFLKESLAAFDAPFFSISAQEASCTDPQQRMLLENSYLALENAGIPIHTVAGSNTSVYVGSLMHDYDLMLKRDPHVAAKHTSVGTGGSMLSNRLSWFYDLRGPSLTVDTACSSSLTALHLACQDIRSGVADMALACGCNAIFDPAVMGDITNMGILSPDSISRSFDAGANGYSRGEGIGVVVLQRLSDAIKSGNTIRAVIRATGINASGRTPGITQPSQSAQAELMRKVYERSGLDPALTKFVEAHGTGTPVGDLLEARAIHNGLGTSKDRDVLYIGAVKSNIGHLEGAAGIAGFIKTVLTVERGVIPPNLHFQRPNRKVDVDEWNVKFPTDATLWPKGPVRRASQNSFGFGGASAHLVIDDAYNYLRLRGLEGRHRTVRDPSSARPHEIPTITSSIHGVPQGKDRQPRLLVWSAPEETALERVLSVHKEHYRNLQPSLQDAGYLADLSYTLNTKRDLGLWRAYGIAASIEDLAGPMWADISKPIRSASDVRVGFVFTGQGAQWPCMGVELMIFKTFARSLSEAEALFSRLGSTWRLIEEMSKPEGNSRMSDPTISQPACTALQIALVDLLRDWNVFPSAVVGHSSGEIAASYCAGCISRETALSLAYYRGLVSSEERICSDGAMLSVNLSEEQVLPYLNLEAEAGSNDYAVIACVNSPKNVTVSGSSQKIEDLRATLREKNVLTQRLNVKTAYHSHRMTAAASKYTTLIANLFTVQKKPTQRSRIISSVTGQEISASLLNTVAHWKDSLTNPVKFTNAMQEILRDSRTDTAHAPCKTHENIHLLVEVGPSTTLKGLIEGNFRHMRQHATVGYASTLTRGSNASETILNTIGHVLSIGLPVDLGKLSRDCAIDKEPTMLVDLPPYPFNHSRKYWIEGPISRSHRFRRFPYHETLGWYISSDFGPGLELCWYNTLSTSEVLWISDHKVNGTVVFPASAMIAMAAEAAKMLTDRFQNVKSCVVHDVKLLNATTVSEENEVQIHTSLRPRAKSFGAGNSDYDFQIRTLYQDEWSPACTGTIAVTSVAQDSGHVGSGATAPHDKEELEIHEPACSVQISTTDMYQYFRTMGLDYRGEFQRLSDIRVNFAGKATATVDTGDQDTRHDRDPCQSYIIHPAALDVVFQTVLASLYRGTSGESSNPIISSISKLSVFPEVIENNRNMVLTVYATSWAINSRVTKASIVGLESSSEALVVETEIEITYLTTQRNRPLKDIDVYQSYSIMQWKPDVALTASDKIQSYCFQSASPIDEAQYYLSSTERMQFVLLVVDKIIKKHKIQPFNFPQSHLVKYFEWMKQLLGEYDLENRGDGLCLSELRVVEEDETFMPQLRSIVEQSGPGGKLIIRTSDHLEDILSETVNFVDLLFNDDLVSEFYASMTDRNPSYQQLAVYLDALAHKTPNLKVLEIGAGTGGATLEVLNALSKGSGNSEKADLSPILRCREYVFTDVSSAFLDKARTRFAPFAERMAFAALNIEEDPAAQGFEPGAFDVIVASNVLHATTSLKQTLSNTRKLLKPNGKLILHEVTDPEWALPPFVFGALPGWWLGSEPEREWSPILSEASWSSYLMDSGFTGVDLVFRDRKNGKHVSSVMVSTAQGATPGPESHAQVCFVADLHSKAQNRIAQSIQRWSSEQQNNFDYRAMTLQELALTEYKPSICVALVEIEEACLDEISEDELRGLKTMLETASTILWVTAASQSSATYAYHQMVVGLARVAQSERAGLRFVTLTIDEDNEDDKVTENISRVLQHTLACSDVDFEPEYLLKNGLLSVNRVVSHEALHKSIASRGGTNVSRVSPRKYQAFKTFKLDAASLQQDRVVKFVETRTATPFSRHEIEVEVKAAECDASRLHEALNSTDHTTVSLSCAGTVTAVGASSSFSVGDRVCCLKPNALENRIRCIDALATRVPRDLTFELAAAVLPDYVTAYIALVSLARVRPGDRVLIDLTSTQSTQITARLAMQHTQAVYVVVDDETKSEEETVFPMIPRSQVISRQSASRRESLNTLLSNDTLDLIITEPIRLETTSEYDRLAPLTRLIQICSQSNAKSYSGTNCMSVTLDLVQLVRDEPRLVREALHAFDECMSGVKDLSAGSTEVLSIGEASTALSSATQRKEQKKIIFTFGNQDAIPIVPLPFALDTDATYVVAGGLGGLGRCIARWILARGGRHIILLSRSGAVSKASQMLLSALKAQGVQVVAPQCDISDRDQLARALSECASHMPPIKGCIHAGMSPSPASIDNLTTSSLCKALAPKVAGSWNLHSLLPKEGLTFFILLSSIAGIVGPHTQAAYAMGNTFQDGLAAHRTALGLPAVSLNLDALLDDGWVAEQPEAIAQEVLNQGFAGMRRATFEKLLDYHCDPARYPLMRPEECQVLTGLRNPAAVDERARRGWFWAERPLFRHLWMRRQDEGENATSASKSAGLSGKNASSGPSYLARLSSASSKAEREAIVLEALRARIAATIDREPGDLDVDSPRMGKMYGIDSLAAVGLREWIRSELDVVLGALEVLRLIETASVRAFAGRITGEVERDREGKRVEVEIGKKTGEER